VGVAVDRYGVDMIDTANAARHPAWWHDLVADPTRQRIVRDLGFLAETAQCQQLLTDIADAVSGIEIGSNQYWPDEPEMRLTITFDDDGEEAVATLTVRPAEPIDVVVPASFARVLDVCRLSYTVGCSTAFLAPVNDEDWDDWQDHFAEYAPDFLGVAVVPVLSRGSDQYVFHPTRRRPNGEPEIVWLAHDGGGCGGGWDTIPDPDLGPGAVFLRALAQRTVHATANTGWH
jgi:hypothetical protein